MCETSPTWTTRSTRRAFERGVPIRALTEETTRRSTTTSAPSGVLMPEDVNEPGLPPRFIEPRATDHIERDADDHRAADRARRRLCGRGARALQRRGDGAPPGVPRYGAFSKRSLDELLAGARVDVAPYKRDPMDFVLWKPSGPAGPGLAVARRHRDARPPGLAYRVLGHGVAPSRRRLRDAAHLRRPRGAGDLRHPRRRHRSRLPAPRERDRPDLLRIRHPAHGECLDA